MKNWLLERFLPMWARNTVLRDLENAERRAEALEQENRVLRAYIRGMKRGMAGRREEKREATAIVRGDLP